MSLTQTPKGIENKLTDKHDDILKQLGIDKDMIKTMTPDELKDLIEQVVPLNKNKELL